MKYLPIKISRNVDLFCMDNNYSVSLQDGLSCDGSQTTKKMAFAIYNDGL